MILSICSKQFRLSLYGTISVLMWSILLLSVITVMGGLKMLIFHLNLNLYIWTGLTDCLMEIFTRGNTFHCTIWIRYQKNLACFIPIFLSQVICSVVCLCFIIISSTFGRRFHIALLQICLWLLLSLSVLMHSSGLIVSLSLHLCLI